uniref:Uncharacterized protein n=1 Tax=Panagrolaimus sp. ES5 TaxID=591445 RepID=A0AC34GWL6_9BILA
KKDLTALNSEEAPEILCQKICGTKKPKHVVTASFGDRENPLENVFDEKDLTLFQNCCFGCQFDKYIIETSKWIFDKTLIKNHVLPTSVKGIHVKGNYGTETNILDIMKVEVNDLLPIKKTAIVPRSIPELQVVLQTQFFTKTCIPDHLRNDCQRYQITLTVNEENFEVVRVDEMEIEDFEDLLEKVESKIPFIGFIDNSSVVAVYKPEEEQYEILDEWNGLYGSDCFISFDEERPKFGDEAKDMLATKNTSVVFDLLKIMSMAPEDIKTEKTWGFSFTRDITNPILVKFDNFDGKKKMSTPSFLMALFLKQHLIIIKEETGEKPKEVALWIFKQDFDEVQMKRIKDGLEEACKLIKIDCSFVDSGDFEVNFIKTDSTKLTY